MNKAFTFLVNHLQSVSRVLLFLGAGLLISWLFPQFQQFKYEYNVGKLWEYDDLYSDYDYAVRKLPKEMAAEEELIKNQLYPFYKKNEPIKEIVIAKAKNGIEQLMLDTTALKFGDRNDLIEQLNEIYVDGIIDNTQVLNLDDNLRLLSDDNNSTLSKANEFYTVRSALDAIINESIPLKNELLLLFDSILEPNIIYDEKTTEKQLSQELENVTPFEGKVQKGQKIISKGELVDEQKFKQIESLKENRSKQLGAFNGSAVYVGYIIIISIMLVLFWIYLKQFHNSVFQNTRKLTFILSMVTAALYFVYLSINLDWPSMYVMPFCALTIILQTYFGNRLAFYTTIIALLLASIISPYGKEFILVHFIACLVSILANVNAYYWSRFFLAILYIFIAYVLSYLGLSLYLEGSFNDINYDEFMWIGLNVILTLLAYPLIPFFEKVFGFISDISLIELSDVNKPLLKKLQLEAPGTFQHSVQVANLAEAAASEIKVNPLLVKVAALYHDIGKIKNPLFFIENQNTNFNPHDNLNYDESAKIIINHVIDGIEIAKSYRLPNILIDFIRTHHGTSKTEYFYRKYKAQNPDIEVDEAQFRYQGPLPYSKETAILMMADTVEAASRSIKNPTEEAIDELIEKLIRGKMDDDQFENSDITFKEIKQVKRVFKKMLKSIYHVRIAYPENNKKDKAA